ncbi:MAG: 23S rRNA methyltransferase [Gammaproteobacteria bacterium]|jgi:23S rRNA (uridine2552-2'-O)-methyltransferase|nr:23S rRNA methyltransferase [Gammaproteobacteria bacterium]
MSKRSKSSHRWLSRQRRDPFARRAASQGQVSRAHFKLEQLDRRFGLVRRGMRVLELGAAPGGWTRYLEERLDGGLLVCIDPRPVSAGADTVVLEGAYGDAAVDERLATVLADAGVDLVLSDMAPNMSGNRTTDQARSMRLADLALDAAARWLNPGGTLAVKMFQGEGVDAWITDLRKQFARVKLTKPDASRAESREVYAIASGFEPASDG